MGSIDFNSFRDRWSPRVEAFFAEYFRSPERSDLKLNSEMAAYHLSTGGKRLRALIPLMVFEALGQNPEKAIPIGVAVEMIHNGTLVHDDLQDGDQLRRGKPTVWKKYSEAQAINCGDAMLFFALQILCETDLPVSLKSRMISRAVASTLNVIEGQAKEFQMKTENLPGVARYLEVVRGKTSGLISLPVILALEALNTDAASCEVIERAASEFGVLFQIQDDVLDLYGEKNRDQKATDIAEGKISILIAHLNEIGSDIDRMEVDRILKKPRAETSRADIQTVLDLLQKYDAAGFALKQVGEIQTRMEQDPGLKGFPEIRGLLMDLGNIFLEPIRQLF